MPGRVFLTWPLGKVAAALGWPVPDLPGDPPRRNIAPGQEVLALTPEGLTRMRWGMIPVGRVNARGRPVMEMIVNARSETVFGKPAFAEVGRAVLPVNGWHEWTGEGRGKTALRITLGDPDALLLFAAISDVWTAPGRARLCQLTTVTCPPNAELRPIHDRMAVILAPADLSAWLTGPPEVAAALMRPLAEGRLKIEPAADVDWDAL